MPRKAIPANEKSTKKTTAADGKRPDDLHSEAALNGATRAKGVAAANAGAAVADSAPDKGDSMAASSKKNAQAIPTLAHTLGEMVWLMTRSPLHRNLKVADLEWLLMPAILLKQFRLFKSGDQVIGLALWAYLTPDQAAEMGKVGRLPADQWRQGTDVRKFVVDQQAGKKPKLIEPDLKDGEVELWLVDFIVPQATPENKLAQTCLADLMNGPLNGKALKIHKTDPKTGEKTTAELGGA